MLYLGLDSSTQSLTAIVIAVEGSRRAVVFERTLDFDAEFPAYGTAHGVLPSADPLVARSSPLMWAEALDRMMGLIAASPSIDHRRIHAISGSAQQHGSVYLNASATDRLRHLDPDTPLAAQLRGTFAWDTAPIWMDASTATECAELASAVGGPEALARLTGSRAFERFTGPQIRAFAKRDPGGYASTERIHLVSSYLASLLIGAHAPLEPGDASGMNLMNIATGDWAEEAVTATAPDLRRKLPQIDRSWSVAGTLAPYWRQRYGFADARVVSWTGDNPSSVVGTGLAHPDVATVSLGTSDTFFRIMPRPGFDPTFAGHVLGNPMGTWMGLICCRNGSLARERVRADFGLDWAGFSDALRRTPAGNQGRIMLPWFEPEITPPASRAGVRRYGLESTDGPANVRAVVEAQMMALASHSRWMGTPPRVIHATGGAAANREVLQVLADVHGADVLRFEVRNAAGLGAALRAYHGDLAADGPAPSWDDVLAGFVTPTGSERLAPNGGNTRRYEALMRAYTACEDHARGRGPVPTPVLERVRREIGSD